MECGGDGDLRLDEYEKLGGVRGSIEAAIAAAVSELGDVVSTLGPAVGVLRSISGGLTSVFPEAENELGEIGNMLSGIMMEAGQGSGGMTLNFDTVNEDASKILNEAATVAEQKIKDKFPDLPPGIPGLPTPPVGEKSGTETS